MATQNITEYQVNGSLQLGSVDLSRIPKAVRSQARVSAPPSDSPPIESPRLVQSPKHNHGVRSGRSRPAARPVVYQASSPNRSVTFFFMSFQR
jgi:hypothetical protein